MSSLVCLIIFGSTHHWILFNVGCRKRWRDSWGATRLKTNYWVDPSEHLIQPLRRVIWSLILGSHAMCWVLCRMSTGQSSHYVRWFLLARYCSVRFNSVTESHRETSRLLNYCVMKFYHVVLLYVVLWLSNFSDTVMHLYWKKKFCKYIYVYLWYTYDYSVEYSSIFIY